MAAMIAAIVLAAGASRRYGSPKQLETTGGESWVRRTARLAREAGCSPVQVVTGAHGERVAGELRDMPGAVAVHHPGWERGIGSSIASGVRSLPVEPPPQGILLLTCDQVALDTRTLKRLIEAFDDEPRRIVACAYEGTVGIPVLFGPGWFERLGRLDGDCGAKTLLLEEPELRIDIDWPAGAADRDHKRARDG